MGIIKDGIKGGKIQLIASNLMKNIQNGGTIDNAKYLMENGHNGIYALYDKAKITTKEIAPMDAIDKAMGFRYGKGPGSLFLHGQCPMVAEVIHNLDNNWKVKNIYDGRPIHTYCEYKAPDGTTFYADARGITNNWDEFVSEFENELSTTDRASLLESNNIRDGVTNTMENGTRGYELTEQWVNGITPVFLLSFRGISFLSHDGERTGVL